jgi:hypothetical protein
MTADLPQPERPVDTPPVLDSSGESFLLPDVPRTVGQTPGETIAAAVPRQATSRDESHKGMLDPLEMAQGVARSPGRLLAPLQSRPHRPRPLTREEVSRDESIQRMFLTP